MQVPNYSRHKLRFYLLIVYTYPIIHIGWRPTYGYFIVYAVGNGVKVPVYWPPIKVRYETRVKGFLKKKERFSRLTV